MNTHAIRLHRVPKAKPELVYMAFYLGWQESLAHLARLVEGGPPPEDCLP